MIASGAGRTGDRSRLRPAWSCSRRGSPRSHRWYRWSSCLRSCSRLWAKAARPDPALLPEAIEPLPHPLKIVAPLRVARIERGKPGAYGEAGLVRRPGRGNVPGTHPDVPNSHPADGKVALPFGVAGVGVGEPLA